MLHSNENFSFETVTMSKKISFKNIDNLVFFNKFKYIKWTKYINTITLIALNKKKSSFNLSYSFKSNRKLLKLNDQTIKRKYLNK